MQDTHSRDHVGLRPEHHAKVEPLLVNTSVRFEDPAERSPLRLWQLLIPAAIISFKGDFRERTELR